MIEKVGAQYLRKRKGHVDCASRKWLLEISSAMLQRGSKQFFGKEKRVLIVYDSKKEAAEDQQL